MKVLDVYCGAQSGALRGIYGRGSFLDPSQLVSPLQGRFLAISAFPTMEFVSRSLVRFVARHAMPWEGIAFDHGGNAGANLVLGRRVLRFRAERAPSLIDGQPTLVMSYEANPWPASDLRDELRKIDDGIALGSTHWRTKHMLGWFGVVGNF